eukprot:6758393-Lingulodinium_polyedra.AAC.1
MRSNRRSAATTAHKSHAHVLHMERARVRLASRCGGRPSIRPHHCARFRKPCTMMRSSRPFITTTTHKSHAHAHSMQTPKLAFAWCVGRVRFASRRGNK